MGTELKQNGMYIKRTNPKSLQETIKKSSAHSENFSMLNQKKKKKSCRISSLMSSAEESVQSSSIWTDLLRVHLSLGFFNVHTNFHNLIVVFFPILFNKKSLSGSSFNDSPSFFLHPVGK